MSIKPNELFDSTVDNIYVVVANWFDITFSANVTCSRDYEKMGDFGVRLLGHWGMELYGRLIGSGVLPYDVLTPMQELIHFNIRQYNATGTLLEYDVKVHEEPPSGRRKARLVPTGAEITPDFFGLYDCEDTMKSCHHDAVTTATVENKEDNIMNGFDIKAIEMTAEQQTMAIDAISSNPFAMAAFNNATVTYKGKTYTPKDLFVVDLNTLNGIYQYLTAAEADAKKGVSLFTGTTTVDTNIMIMEDIVEAVFRFKVARAKADEQRERDMAAAEEDAKAARDILRERKYDAWRAKKSDAELQAIGYGLVATTAEDEIQEMLRKRGVDKMEDNDGTHPHDD